MKILGIITARGGSKRIPRKNIKNFLGKPLLAWTIDVALNSGVLDRLVLSTEDVFRRIITLPLFPEMGLDKLVYVVEMNKDVLSQ